MSYLSYKEPGYFFDEEPKSFKPKQTKLSMLMDLDYVDEDIMDHLEELYESYPSKAPPTKRGKTIRTTRGKIKTKRGEYRGKNIKGVSSDHNRYIQYIENNFDNVCVIGEIGTPGCHPDLVDLENFYKTPTVLNWLITCLMSNKRFVFIYAPIIGMGVMHANVLLYDKHTNVLDRFDPWGEPVYGFGPISETDLTTEIDHYKKGIVELFNNAMGILGQGPIIYIDSSEYCILGPQTVSENMNPSGRYIGLCVPWAMIYIDMRLTFPEIPPNHLMRHIISLGPEKLNQLIVNYFHKIKDWSKKHGYYNKKHCPRPGRGRRFSKKKSKF